MNKIAKIKRDKNDNENKKVYYKEKLLHKT